MEQGDENSISLKLKDGRQSIEKLSKIQSFYLLRQDIYEERGVEIINAKYLLFNTGQ